MQNHIRPIGQILTPYATRREAYKEASARAFDAMRDEMRGHVPFGRRLAVREPAFDRSNRKGA